MVFMPKKYSNTICYLYINYSFIVKLKKEDAVLNKKTLYK